MSEILLINKKLFSIAKKLSSEDIEGIKFLYNDVIGEKKLEDAKDGKALLKLLKENNILNTVERIDQFCEDTLVEIGREDIRNHVLGKETSNEQSTIKSGNHPKLKNGLHKRRRRTNLPTDLLEIVAYKIAGDWRRFARKLGHDEGVIEQVDLDFRKTYDKTYEILTRWIEHNDVEVTWATLKEKLEKMPRYDIVREVEGTPEFSEVVKKSSENGATLSTNQIVDLPAASLISASTGTTTTTSNATASTHNAEQTSDSFSNGKCRYALGGTNLDKADTSHFSDPDKKVIEEEDELVDQMKTL